MKGEAWDRFWSKVWQNPGGCWEWFAGFVAPAGYGIFNFKGHNCYAHRVSWELVHGEIPPGMNVLHKCDNPLCVRPSHLFLGSLADNCTNRHIKGRDNPPKGTTHSHSKLDESKVREMREKRRTRTIKSLAQEYGVGWTTAQAVVSHRTWKHVRP